MSRIFYFVTKFSVAQAYGGPEEGGWWYDSGVPAWHISIPVPTERLAYALCRFLNEREHLRRERENTYEYTSVLSGRDDFYSFDLSDTFRPKPYPAEHPYYC